MFWEIVFAFTFLTSLIDLNRVIKDSPDHPIAHFIGRIIGNFLWILAIVWVISVLVKLFS